MNNTNQTIQAGQSTYLNDINKGLPIGTSSSFSQVGNVPVNPVPNASQVSSVNPVKVPDASVDTSLSNLNAHLGSAITPPPTATVDNTSGTAQLPPQSQNTGGNNAIMTKLTGLYDKLTGKADFTTNLQDQLQVNQKEQAAVDTFNQYNQRRLQLAKQEQDFLNTNTGQSEQTKNYQYNELRRNNAYELANQAIAVQAAQGNYTAALDTIKRKTDAVYQPLQDQIDNLTKFYQLNQNDLTESEKMTLQTKIDEQKAQKKVLSDAYENTLKTLAENGAPADVYSAVDKASKDPSATASSIIASAGKYATNLLDRQYKQAQISNIYSDIKKREADLNPVGGDNPQLYTGLKPATATAVRSQVGAFKTEPLVQNFAVIQEGRNFAGSLDNKTTNPADDQALIYSLAKALDPGSVVREGEYATAQKYAQSWLAAYGKGVTQALAGTGFLSETARKNIKDTIETKYKSSLRSYNNLANQYEKGINDLTGRNDGSKFIRSYVTPSAGQTVKAPDGQEIIITD